MGKKSVISGILSIISGVFGLIGAGSMLFLIRIVNRAFETDFMFPYRFEGFVSLMYGTTGVVLALLSILCIVGGIYAIMKKYWGLGLAAAIASIIAFFPCGIAAVVLIALGKEEYNRPAAVPPGAQPPPSM